MSASLGIPAPSAPTPRRAPEPGFDAAVVGAGVMGCSVALHLAYGGMRVALLDRGPLCGGATGADAGLLGVQASPPVLLPYARRGQEMWLHMAAWAGGGHVQAVACPGLSLAFTERDAVLLQESAQLQRQAGAPVMLISGGRAMEIEPGLTDKVLLAAHCPAAGFASAHLTGRAFRSALLTAGVEVFEDRPVSAVDQHRAGFTLATPTGAVHARRLVLAGGARLGEMAGWLGFHLPIRVRSRRILVTDRMRPMMRTVLSMATEQLHLAQHGNGTAMIDSFWPEMGERPRDETLREAVRLAAFAIPMLRAARLLRTWPVLEAETVDALPALGPVPGVPGAWIIGGVPAGYASGPCFGMLLAQAMLGLEPELPLFPVDRLPAREIA